MAQRRFIATITLAGMVFASTPAWSVGSVAIGLPDDVAQGGFAMGIARNYSSQGEADSEALRQCLSFMDAPDSTRALCKIYTHFTDQCFAMAMDPEPATYGFGYKVSGTQDSADSAAMRDCRNTSADSRKDFCQVSFRGCDGTAH